jgi:uncharacterized protein YndB with AHSA1/START domain
MIRRLVILVLLSIPAWGSAAQQHPRQSPKAEDTGSVTVMYSATLQNSISSDAVSIFSYLSDQRKLTAWLADQAILEPQFGGKYHFRWKNQEAVDGVVTELVAANTLALSWKHPTDTAETQVRFKLSPQGGQTAVDMELRGLTSAAALDKVVKFWVFYLQNLKSVIENQVDLRQAASKAPGHSTPHTRAR